MPIDLSNKIINNRISQKNLKIIVIFRMIRLLKVTNLKKSINIYIFFIYFYLFLLSCLRKMVRYASSD